MDSTTFILDPERIRTILIDKINQKEQTVSFFDYLVNLNTARELHHMKYLNEWSKPFRAYDAEKIIFSLMDVQDMASVDDLGIVFDWLLTIEAFIWDYNEGDTPSYAHYGFIEIYDLGQSDKCWVYGNQEREFAFLNNQDFDHYDGSFGLYPNAYYRNYLGYLQLLLTKICLDKEYKNHVYDYTPVEEMVRYLMNHRMNQELDDQTESSLLRIRESNQAYDIASGYNGTQRRDYTQSHYLVAGEMFYQINDVKRLLGDYSGNIFIFHSY